jgi:hypothetical protein
MRILWTAKAIKLDGKREARFFRSDEVRFKKSYTGFFCANVGNKLWPRQVQATVA